MPYVDGFVVPVPKKNVAVYRRLARRSGRIWRDHGALLFYECLGEDLRTKFGTPFPKMARLKPGETVFFSFIVFRSRSHRDKVNAKVMKDPRLEQMMDGQPMPFDVRRMAYGGFKVIVDA